MEGPVLTLVLARAPCMHRQLGDNKLPWLVRLHVRCHRVGQCLVHERIAVSTIATVTVTAAV